MDQGPFRMPRPAAPRPERRSEPAPATSNRQPQAVEPAQQPTVNPPIAEPPAKSASPASRPSRWPFLVVIILIVLGLGLASFSWLNQDHSVGNFIETDTYQAVFSANGQVYFGKLNATSGDELRLSDVYYVQASDATEVADQESTNSNDLELIKLGSNEVYGPQDEMVFIKDQVLYYENLDPDGKVSNLIRDNQDN